MYHLRKTRRHYNKQLVDNQTLGCPFCRPETLVNKTEDRGDFYLVKNSIQYDLWEGHVVADHLLLVPKKHVESLQELTDKQRLAMMDIVSEYEARGHSVYARGVDSPRRSVAHQHTHLIKIVGRRARILFFLEKPYWLFKV
jgi:galactose-1-phosphate uridylyltransferase